MKYLLILLFTGILLVSNAQEEIEMDRDSILQSAIKAVKNNKGTVILGDFFEDSGLYLLLNEVEQNANIKHFDAAPKHKNGKLRTRTNRIIRERKRKQGGN